MPTILLDLDHTLLDSTAFKTALAKSLELTPAAWDQAYTQFVQDNGQFHPTVFLHGASQDQQRAFTDVVRHIRKYLYPDSLLFLRSAQQAGYRLLVITFGAEDWQQQKLDALKLPDYVQTVPTSQAKVEKLAQYIEDVTLVVDDKAAELEALYQQWPQLQLYWIRRANGKYREIEPTVPHHTITQLSEIKL